MRVARLWHSRSAVSPVIGVILMVAATIVIASIVMAYLGGFNPPKRNLDIQLTNAELKTDDTNWTLTFTLSGADADKVTNETISITLFNQNTGISTPIQSQNVTVTGNLIIANGNNATLDIDQGHRVKVVVEYTPTGQLLFDGVLIAKRVE